MTRLPLGALCDMSIIRLAAGPSWARLLAGPEQHDRPSDHFTSSKDAIPLLSPGAIDTDGSIVPGDDQRLHPATAGWPTLTQYRLETGDILLSRQGALGHSALVSWPERGWFYNAALYRLRLDVERADRLEIAIIPEYLHAHLSRPRVREWMISQAVGQTVRTLTIERLRALEIPLPSLAEQERLSLQVRSIDQQMARHRQALLLLSELKTATIG
jgi:type I restriction enzyme S subunit